MSPGLRSSTNNHEDEAQDEDEASGSITSITTPTVTQPDADVDILPDEASNDGIVQIADTTTHTTTTPVDTTTTTPVEEPPYETTTAINETSSTPPALMNQQQQEEEEQTTSSIPPLLIQPPQPNNNNQSFAEQAIISCLSAYEASPAYNSPRQPVVDNDKEDAPPPRIIHFIFLGDNNNNNNNNMTPTTTGSSSSSQRLYFTFLDYLIVRAAYFRIQPDAIYLHTTMPPADMPLWDLIKPMIAQLKHLDEPPNTTTGSAAAAAARQSKDISILARLQVLQEYGGLYMDIDTLALRRFTDDMWNPPTGCAAAIMGYYQDNKPDIDGCGIIVAKKSSVFLQKWMESYQTYTNDTTTIT